MTLVGMTVEEREGGIVHVSGAHGAWVMAIMEVCAGSGLSGFPEAMTTSQSAHSVCRCPQVTRNLLQEKFHNIPGRKPASKSSL